MFRSRRLPVSPLSAGVRGRAIVGSLRSTKELVANALRSIRRRQSCKVPGSTPCTGAMVIGSVKQLPARRWGVRAGKPRRHTNGRSVGKTPRSFSLSSPPLTPAAQVAGHRRWLMHVGCGSVAPTQRSLACVASSLTLDATSYEASLVKLRVIWSTVSDLSHLFDPPGSVAGPEGAWRGRPAGWVDGVQGRPADHLLSVPACVAGHPIPRAP